MFQQAGAFKSKEDKNGALCHLHRLADGPQPETDLSPPHSLEAKRADADTLNEVYTALLVQLTLNKTHREALQARGLTDDAIDRAGYRTLPGPGRPRIARDLRQRFGDKLLRVPGFVVKQGESGRYLTLRGPAGLLIPCRDRAGHIVAMKVRRDNVSEGTSRYCYISSAGHGGPGSGSPVHVPAGMPKSAELVRLIEGELKADIVYSLTGLPTVSIPGVSNWRPALAELKAMGCKTVRLAFDADATDNVTVARALSGCADALTDAGISVELERWDAVNGKGLDDLRAAGKMPELLQGEAALQAVREILATSSADEEPAPPNELTRLQDVLDAGGAEALFRDKALMQALADLAQEDPAGFAAVRASIRERVSVRDLDKALRPLVRQLLSERPAPPAAQESPIYFVKDSCICRSKPTADGAPITIPLCNFSACITDEVVRDDGVERTTVLAIEGNLSDGTCMPRAEVPAEDFVRMEWPVRPWGTRAVVYAGQGTRDHLRAALQLLSKDPPRRTVYCHTGWRKIEDNWVFLHAGGAIGAHGAVPDIVVSLPDPLSGFQLRDPPNEQELVEAIRASLRIRDLGPDSVTFPQLASAFRAVLGEADFSEHTCGPTGSFKTEVAALIQQHFGAGLDARHLPANWSSTGNSLEGLAFAAKDVVLVVDDFCPTGSTADVQRYHREADRLFRGQGNHAGRLRMRADATLRSARPPRGLILSTGEDTPRGQSLRARLFMVEYAPGDIDIAKLTACQQDAAAGKYAATMAGYIRWLAPHFEEIRSRLRQKQADFREQAAAEGQHARTPAIVADLALGLWYFLDFAEAMGAITPAERTELWRRGFRVLREAGDTQAAQIQAAEPAGLFLRLLSAALASGRAHVANATGCAPKESERWGWQLKTVGTGPNTRNDWQPQGHRIGWVEDQDLYLEPDAAFATAQELAREQGDSLPVTPHTLRKRLREKGLLVSVDERRKKLTVRKTLQGTRRDVLHLKVSAIPPTNTTGPIGPESQEAQENGPISWAGARAGNGQVNGEPAHNMTTAGTSGQSPAAVGPEMGQLGRSGTGDHNRLDGITNPSSPSDWDEV
jgi:hypothetical protein